METAGLLSLIQGLLALVIVGLVWPLIIGLRAERHERQRRAHQARRPDRSRRLVPRWLRREG